MQAQVLCEGLYTYIKVNAINIKTIWVLISLLHLIHAIYENDITEHTKTHTNKSVATRVARAPTIIYTTQGRSCWDTITRNRMLLLDTVRIDLISINNKHKFKTKVSSRRDTTQEVCVRFVGNMIQTQYIPSHHHMCVNLFIFCWYFSGFVLYYYNLDNIVSVWTK